MSDKTFGPINSKNYYAKKRKLFLNSALNTLARPISLEGLEALKVGGFLATEVFNQNVGTIFPLVLELVSIGKSIHEIEAFMGMAHHSLARIIQRHPRLKEACNRARLIKNDRAVIQ